MTISDDRLTSPKYLAFLEKFLSRHYWTADDYESLPDELEAEIYDGRIHVVPSPTLDHQVTMFRLASALDSALGGGRRMAPDIDVNVMGKIYRPDIVVLRETSDRQPTPGDLVQVVVEIISQNENVERSGKMTAYAAQGIPLYLIIGGGKGMHFAEVYRLDGQDYELQTTVQADARMEFEEPFPFVLDMKQINS